MYSKRVIPPRTWVYPINRLNSNKFSLTAAPLNRIQHIFPESDPSVPTFLIKDSVWDVANIFLVCTW